MDKASTTKWQANDKTEYVPGVCNIGPAEQAKRRQAGIIGTAVANLSCS